MHCDYGRFIFPLFEGFLLTESAIFDIATLIFFSLQMTDVPGLNVLVNLSATEIHKLTDQIIAKSKEVHDLVASVPLEKV